MNLQEIISKTLHENCSQVALTQGEQMNAIDSDSISDIAEDIENQILENLESASSPLIKYLCDNYHPHVSAIVTPTSIEVLEGLESIPKIYEHVRD